MSSLDELKGASCWTGMGAPFLTPVEPSPLGSARWLATHPQTALDLGLSPDWWHSPRALACMAGNAPSPLGPHWASVYSGHQFGVWAGQLGDGRAMSLGEVAVAAGVLELQLKGSGRTPYSRFGDGRAVLRSSIREYLCSHAMQGLGIPTTRALCLVTSDEPVMRETLETAAVVCRVSPSFIRFGHFEHFSATGQHEALAALVKHVWGKHFAPGGASGPGPHAQPIGELALALFRQVVHRTADLMAQWQSVGFCHGVMNTDNMSVLGLTMDYGPFQFMDAYDPSHICNHTDAHGRYAYAQQPSVAHWNLLALAHALHPLMASSEGLQEALGEYAPRFQHRMASIWAHKLGLAPERQTPQACESVWPLVQDWLALLARHRADFTLSWRGLSRLCASPQSGQADQLQSLSRLHLAWPVATDPGWMDWLLRHRDWLGEHQQSLGQAAQTMLGINPARVLRNHLAELAIRQAAQGDPSEVQSLQLALANPFTDDPQWAQYAQLPPQWASDLHISCSS